MDKKDKNKKKPSGSKAAIDAYREGSSLHSDVLGSYTGLPINEKMISKNVSGGKTYMRLYSSKETPTQDADDL